MNTQTTDQEKQRHSRTTRYHIAIFMAAAGVLIAGGIWRGGREQGTPSSEMALIEQLRQEVSGLQVGVNVSELDAIEETVVRAVRAVAPAVIAVLPVEETRTLRTVAVYGDVQNAGSELPSSAAFSPALSGILLDREGYVLTSANVSQLGPRVQLLFADGGRRDALVHGTDAGAFIGLLKMISPPPIVALPDFSRQESELRSGEWLVRYGRSPSGRESRSLCLLESLRVGIRERVVGILDRPAAPEMDGGGLVDVRGRIAGIYVAPPGAPAFMVPVSQALNIANRLKNSQEPARRSWIGIELQDLTEELRDYLNVEAGALITRVEPGGPADRAGLEPGDIVQSAGQKVIVSALQLMSAIQENDPGTTIPIVVRRNSRERIILVITEAPAESRAGRASNEETLNIRVGNRPGIQGAVVTEVGPAGIASRAGIRAGDVIQGFDSTPIRNSAALLRLGQNLAIGKPHLFEISRQDRVFFIALKETLDIHE
jgi:S1-C subfamily serine protease